MSKLLRLVIVAAVFCGTIGRLAAAPLNFNFFADKRRFDAERTSTASTNISKEKWGYNVTIENKSFQALDDLEVQYKVFKHDDTRKGAGKTKGIPGSTKITKLGNGEKFKFDTEPVEIDKAELKAGWSYTDGGKSKVKDAVQGIWLRVMKDGQVVSEFQSPPELKNKVKWE